MGEEERFGMITRLPLMEQAGIIMDSEGGYYDILYDDLCKSVEDMTTLKTGQIVGFSRKNKSEAVDIRLINQ